MYFKKSVFANIFHCCKYCVADTENNEFLLKLFQNSSSKSLLKLSWLSCFTWCTDIWHRQLKSQSIIEHHIFWRTISQILPSCFILISKFCSATHVLLPSFRNTNVVTWSLPGRKEKNQRGLKKACANCYQLDKETRKQ